MGYLYMLQVMTLMSSPACTKHILKLPNIPILVDTFVTQTYVYTYYSEMAQYVLETITLSSTPSNIVPQYG